MKKAISMFLVAALAAAGASTARANFVLSDNEHLDVTTSHTTAVLWDYSTADILSGGYISNAYVEDNARLRVQRPNEMAVGTARVYKAGQIAISSGYANSVYAYDTSSVDISGGGYAGYLYAYVTSSVAISGGGFASYLYAYDTSSVDISGGYVYSGVYAYNTSSVDISGGNVYYGLYAYDTSSVAISGGSVPTLGAYNTSSVDITDGTLSRLYAYNTSSVAMSGGTVSTLYARDTSSVAMSGGSVSTLDATIRSLGGTINITGGTVTNLYVDVFLQGSEHLAISGAPMPVFPASFGVTLSEGTVSNTIWQAVRATGTSSVDITGGSVTNLYADDTSSVDINGGSASNLYAYDTSSVDISGGSVTNLYASDTSSVTLYGRAFRATGGLSLAEYDVIDGVSQYEVLGTGVLTGKWFDGAPWVMVIGTNASTATIHAVPEPATVCLLGLGLVGLVLRRRRK